MKALKDVSWPHFKPTENLHVARSNPSLKASSTIYLHPERVNGSDPSFRRSSESAYGPDEPIRELSPRPEPDSRTLTPEPAPKISDPELEKIVTTPESHPGTLILEFNSEGLKPPISTEEFNKPEVLLPALSGEKENIDGIDKTQLPPSPSVSAKEVSASLKGLQIAVTAMGLRGSGTISPLSDGSINDLIQSMPDSPVSEQIPGQVQADFKWKTSKKIPRIDVSESSIDEPLAVFLPLTNTSNVASTFPTIQTVTSSHSVVIVPELQQRTFDGPASIAIVTKDFSHAPGDCPTIAEANELRSDAHFPLNIEGLTKTVPRPSIVNDRLHVSAFENIPVVDGSFLKQKLPTAPDMPVIPTAQLMEAPGLPGLPSMPTIPGLPADATGLASVPATPAPNLNKKQKLKVKGQKAIRRCRRLVMRRSVMTVLLGRQLAGPTVDGLKLISKSGKGAIRAVTSEAPVPMLM